MKGATHKIGYLSKLNDNLIEFRKSNVPRMRDERVANLGSRLLLLHEPAAKQPALCDLENGKAGDADEKPPHSVLGSHSGDH